MFTKISRVLSALLIAGILLGSVTFPTDVSATSIITVTTTDDELNTDGDCSLREAIQAANTDSAVDACPAGTGADTITVPAGTYTLTIAGASEDANATGDLDITGSVTINGAGVGTTVIRNIGTDRVLHIFFGITVGLSDVTIANGNADYNGYGGGIANNGTLAVTNSTFSGNGAYKGGGIYNDGHLTVMNSTFSGNYSYWEGSGGGIYNQEYGTLIVTNSTFSGNSGDRSGGGINNHLGDLTVTNSAFLGNTAFCGGAGGGIRNTGTLTVTNSLFSSNTAFKSTGVCDFLDALPVTNNVFLDNSPSEPESPGMGGGIYNYGTLTVTNSTFLDNFASDDGGGIYNDSQGLLTVTNSTFSDNYSYWGGGGIHNSYGTLTVTNSTFSDNSARLYGGIVNLGNLTLNNSILANTLNNRPDCFNSSYGTVNGGHNLIETDYGGAFACGTTNPIHTDPNLGPLADNGGLTQTFALLPGSPAIDMGDDSVCAATPVNNTSQNGVTRPQGAHCDIGSYERPVTITTLTRQSVGTKDGWILESTETSGMGGTMNVNGQAIALGDDMADKQYRSILHFDTASLPENAVITKVTLKVKKKAVFGTDPFTTHQYIKVDIKSGSFSNNPTLQLTDFQSAASKNWVGTIKNTPVGGWYSAVLKNTAFPYINLIGVTQLRLYFNLDDDNDNIADYIQFFSGNVAAADRPQLIVEYYVP